MEEPRHEFWRIELEEDIYTRISLVLLTASREHEASRMKYT